MASKPLSDLCRIILRDVYGELAAIVVGALFDHGRLTVSMLVRYTKLPIQTINRTLVALLQNRFVLYWPEAGSAYAHKINSPIHYSANWTEIYRVLWAGRILAIVNDKPDSQKSADIVKNMLVFGHMRISDYISAHSNQNGQEIKEVQEALRSLVSARYLVPLLQYEFQPMEDIYREMFTKHLAREPRTQSESSRQTSAKSAAEIELNSLLSQKEIVNKAQSEIRSNKKLISSTTAGDESVYCINQDKFLVVSRNRELVSLVSRRIGPVTAKVYEWILARYEVKLSTCSQEIEPGVDYNISSIEILRGIDNSLDLKNSIILNNESGKRKSHGNHVEPSPKKRIKTENSYSQVDIEPENSDSEESVDLDALLSDEENNSYINNETFNGSKFSIRDLNRHLELLADSQLLFLLKVGNKGGGEWFVPFKQLSEKMREATYQDIISHKYGPIATRLLRVIKEKGKVDEKLFSQVTLLQAKDIRNYLTDLHSIGCIDLQEVPRSNDRAPGRSFYLWHHRAKRAYSQMLQNLYTTISRLYSRIITERSHHPILLAKLERVDVKGHEETYLSEQEKSEISDLRTKEEKLLVQIARLDDLVRIFRDY